MLTLSQEEFLQKLKAHELEIAHLINNVLPEIVGVMAVNHFKENFQNEAWGRSKWPEVKRRMATWTRKGKVVPNPTKGAKRSRKILTGDTGDLGRSIQYTPESGKVTIHSDLIYASVHNFGERAGRGAGFIMPKRQFIGEDEILNQKIKSKIEQQLEKIFSK